MSERLKELKKELFQIRYEMSVFAVKRANNENYNKYLNLKLAKIKEEIAKEMVWEERERKRTK